MASKDDGGGKSPLLQPIHHHHCGGAPHRHHHHFFYVSPHCPHHSPILLPQNHSPSCSFASNPSPQNPNYSAPVPLHPQLTDLHTNSIFNDAQVVDDETEKVEDEEEEDPIFVLTDEWREFFAKSEAKRRQAKKQDKKQAKKGK